MNQIEMVKKICKDRNISIHKLEMDCGFANGYISQLRKGVFPADRALKIANYLDIPIDDFIENKNPILIIDESHSMTDNHIISQELKNAFTFPEQDIVKISDEAKDIAVDFMNAPDDVKRAVRTLLKCYKLDL